VQSTILIIEDDPNDVILMLHALETLRNEKIVKANAQDALDYLDETNDLPIMILLDLGLPGMDGAAFAVRVRHNPRTRHIPIVVITGDPDDEARMFSLQVNAYLLKPLTGEALAGVLPKLHLKWGINHD
jgi:CheY-like chemotaxis protein